MYSILLVLSSVAISVLADSPPVGGGDVVSVHSSVVKDIMARAASAVVVQPQERNSSPPPAVRCRANEIVTDCLTPCEPTCEHPNQLPCPEFTARRTDAGTTAGDSADDLQPIERNSEPPVNCRPGCVCDHGFVRSVLGVCIPRSQCQPICKPHSHFESCGPRCQITCEFAEPRASTVCSQDSDVCVSGCFCDAGYIKDIRTGQCVRPQDCSQLCPDNEHYSDYGNPCAPSCQQLVVPPAKCLNYSQHLPGCYCNQGFIRDWSSKRCVRDWECPSMKCPSTDEQWYQCRPCTPSCTEPKRVCTGQCQPSGCDCKRGLYRNPTTGQCIRFCDCPQFHR
ncbi:zonadhesin-like [Oppia nitens]|uniref:zonadhesin-like n=1 Tax=Oppia nitens TaxID=1686743 RepID=UPI0023DA523D|nr:zonadhesin-like [Oppia nitens]